MSEGTPKPSLTTSRRLDMLRRLKRAWQMGAPSSVDTIEVHDHIPTYDLQKGVLTLGSSEPGSTVTSMGSVTNSIRFQKLRSNVLNTQPESWTIEQIGFPVKDYTTDPDQDLIAYIAAPEATSNSTCYRIHFRTMSDNQPHPLAEAKTFVAEIAKQRTVGWPAVPILVLRGPLIALLVSRMGQEVGLMNLWLWNWRTGCLVKIIESDCEASFSFLDDSSFVVGKNHCTNFRTRSWELEVNFLSEPPAVVTLELPELHEGALVDELCSRSDPNSPSRRTYRHARPFVPDPDNALLTLSAVCIPSHGPQQRFVMFCVTSTLLRLARTALINDPLRRVKWSQWGPENTRWARNLFANSVCNVHGLRYASTSGNSLSIMDFNPYSISPKTRGGAPYDEWANEAATTRCITEPSITALPNIFAEPFVSSLPYHETRVRSSSAIVELGGALMLDEERILTFSDLSAVPIRCNVLTM